MREQEESSSAISYSIVQSGCRTATGNGKKLSSSQVQSIYSLRGARSIERVKIPDAVLRSRAPNWSGVAGGAIDKLFMAGQVLGERLLRRSPSRASPIPPA